MFAIDNNTEADSLDEALIPYDAKAKYSSHYQGEKHLRDDILSESITNIREKAGANGLVVVLLDACHSGDSFRNPDDLANYRGGYPVFGPNSQDISVHKDLRDIIKLPKSHYLSEVIFMGACQSYQLNAEYKAPDGNWYGSLTYAFFKAFEKNGLNSMVSLCLDIKSNVKAFNKSTRQTPEFATTIESILVSVNDTCTIDTTKCDTNDERNYLPYWMISSVLALVLVLIVTYIWKKK
jgi:hypothetical protein